MESLIFSINRPMQLELCLHSHQLFWGEKITVLYKATEPEYQEGYEVLKEEYPDVNFLKEDDFKQQVVDYVKRNKYTLFYCDDDIIIKPITKKDEKKIKDLLKTEDLLCVSMRLDKKYDYHFETDSIVPRPEFKDNFWMWEKALFDWNFPMSVLGHVFRSEDMLPLCEDLIYSTPNYLESELAKNYLDKPLMACLDEAKNINIPSNVVQTTHPNRAGNVSIEGLNKSFLEGDRIDIDDVLDQTKDARSCFMLIDFKYIKP